LKPLSVFFAPATETSTLGLVDFENLPYLDMIAMVAGAATHGELKSDEPPQIAKAKPRSPNVS